MTETVLETESADPRDIVVRADANGVLLFVSPSCRTMGWEPEDLVGRQAAELVHPDDLTRFAQNSASLFEEQPSTGPRNRVHRFRRGDGSWVWLQGHPIVLRTHDGRHGDVVNVFRIVEDFI